MAFNIDERNAKIWEHGSNTKQSLEKVKKCNET